jgi:lantibiotic modifying enzyme
MFLGVAGWGLVSLHFFLETRRQSYLEQAVKAGEHLVHIAQHEGTTSFWRSKYDGLVHFGYGFGASGIALFLMYLYKATKSSEFRTCAIRALDFDLAHRVEGESGWHWRRFENDTLLYPYWIHGSAGIGSTLIRFSHWLGIKRYEILAREIAEDTIVKYAFIPSLFEGLAGIGEFALDMFQFTGDESYRLKALDIADTILWFKINKPQGVAYPGRWLTRISCDYGTGSAGIGLFLKRLLVPGRRVAVDLDLEKLKHVPKTLRAHSVS